MRLCFDLDKATEAAAYLLAKHGGKRNYMALIKMLYLADRQALLNSGYPITGDEMYSMRNGPVLSRILDFITWGDSPRSGPGAIKWQRHVGIDPQDSYAAILRDNPGRDHLSDEELGILDDVFARFHKMNQWDLRDLTHTLAEWSNTSSSKRIDPAEILRNEGWPTEDIQAAIRAAEQRWQMHHSQPQYATE